MSRLTGAAYLLSALAFGALSYFAHRFPNFPGDVDISLRFQSLNLPLFEPVMRAASFINSLIPAVIIVAIICVTLWALRKRLEVKLLVPLTLVDYGLNQLLKLLINRPRPGGELVEVMVAAESSSFPSGHALHAVVFYGFLFGVMPTLIHNPAASNALRAVSVLIIALTMASRIYLGAHWFSDVLGGAFLGGLLLAPALVLYNSYSKRGADA